jgi:hypothetical protein
MILLFFGAFTGLVTLTNPAAMGLAMAALLIGVLMIAIASFVGL